MFRLLTAGESHGPALSVIIEGLPAGLAFTTDRINRELARRQVGYGRGGRMKIETDQVEIMAGVRHGETLGSPVSLLIHNRDWKNWTEVMAVETKPAPGKVRPIVRPRPGHADLVGVLKYDRRDIRDILERASARETAARVAAGACAKIMLEAFDVTVGSWVESIGTVSMRYDQRTPRQLAQAAEKSDVRCPDPRAAKKMHQAIDQVIAAGDTLGGVFVVTALGLPPGLGSHVHWDRKLDMRLASAVMSIQAIKGVAIGLGFEAASLTGAQVHDVITYRAGKGYGRKTNHAGGLEGGMTTGEPLLVKGAMKPIATLKQPLRSVDMTTKKSLEAGYERSDHCAVPAAGVVGEAMVAMELAKAWQEKFGGDALKEMTANWKAYLKQVTKR